MCKILKIPDRRKTIGLFGYYAINHFSMIHMVVIIRMDDDIQGAFEK